jgi:hypothetical protein
MPVISFRPTPEEEETIESIRKAHGFPTRAEAVRYLIRQGARTTIPWQDDPLFRFKAPRTTREDDDITSSDINRGLYGWK